MKIHRFNRPHPYMFECVIHGRIVMTAAEWRKAYAYLRRGWRRWYPSQPWVHDHLEEDAGRMVESSTGGHYINIRVPQTEALVRHFKVPGYRRGNYIIHVRR